MNTFSRWISGFGALGVGCTAYEAAPVLWSAIGPLGAVTIVCCCAMVCFEWVHEAITGESKW